MRLKHLTLSGFKSFANKTEFFFDEAISAVVGPNGSGKSNVVEAIRFVLGEQSNKSLRSRQTADLIFKGGDRIKASNRAEVSIVFDNSDRAFRLHNDDNSALELANDQITISRTVHQDGGSEYKINNAPVRLRDIHELIASVNIGTSSHHIISQGEADRVLTSSPRLRREMIEDALGLKVYQFRMKEAERKLEKAAQNMRELDLQRKELAPQLKYLKREMERIEKAKILRTELETEYKEYLSREYSYLQSEKERMSQQRQELMKNQDLVAAKQKELRQMVDDNTDHDLRDDLRNKKMLLQSNEAKLRDSEREVGQLEGKLAAVRETLQSFRNEDNVEVTPNEGQPVSRPEIQKLTDALLQKADSLERESSLAALHAGMTEIKTLLHKFWEDLKVENKPQRNHGLGVLIKLESQLGDLEDSLEKASRNRDLFDKERKEAEHQISVLQDDLRTKENARNSAERELINARAELEKITASLGYQERNKQIYLSRQRRFESEIEEGVVLVGQAIKQYHLTNKDFSADDLSDQVLQDLLRNIERKKLKLEEMGAGGGREVVDAYQEAADRDTFLSQELTDISTTIDKLTELRTELEQTLQTSFLEGVDKISAVFHQFFTAMFGGGRANLELVAIKRRKRPEEDADIGEPEESGIAIRVKIPNKKVAEIDMLSGGERSLTSIALLFALSQVNPPPFLVLDETDAALDEANSRRYGDMLERLSQVAQLVVVTHNRETMSRAQNLYGVTMQASGASQVLSIKLEEALESAK